MDNTRWTILTTKAVLSLTGQHKTNVLATAWGKSLQKKKQNKKHTYLYPHTPTKTSLCYKPCWFPTPEVPTADGLTGTRPSACCGTWYDSPGKMVPIHIPAAPCCGTWYDSPGKMVPIHIPAGTRPSACCGTWYDSPGKMVPIHIPAGTRPSPWTQALNHCVGMWNSLNSDIKSLCRCVVFT